MTPGLISSNSRVLNSLKSYMLGSFSSLAFLLVSWYWWTTSTLRTTATSFSSIFAPLVMVQVRKISYHYVRCEHFIFPAAHSIHESSDGFPHEIVKLFVSLLWPVDWQWDWPLWWFIKSHQNIPYRGVQTINDSPFDWNTITLWLIKNLLIKFNNPFC